jgi:hypothetical protein
MNHSIYTADQATHLKVVVSVLLIGIAIIATTLTARLAHPEVNGRTTANQTPYKAHPDRALTEMARIEKEPI